MRAFDRIVFEEQQLLLRMWKAAATSSSGGGGGSVTVTVTCVTCHCPKIMGACLSSLKSKPLPPKCLGHFITVIRFCPVTLNVLFPVSQLSLARGPPRVPFVSVVSHPCNPPLATCGGMAVIVIDLLRLHQGNDTQQLKWL